MSYPIYEPGDIVRIDDYAALCSRSQAIRSSGALDGFFVGFVSDMQNYCGLVRTIKDRHQHGDKYFYHLEGTPWSWSTDMFDLSFSPEPELDFHITDTEILQILNTGRGG